MIVILIVKTVLKSLGFASNHLQQPTSCKKADKEESFTGDYLVFGHFYGECMGEGCVETYKLTDTKLYEDTNDNYSGAEPFSFIELPADKFDLVVDLPDDFPTELLEEEDGVFGCPDCADQGGLLIRYAKNGAVRTWRIDQNKNEGPAYLHAFMDRINEKIDLINQ